jgi:hypothetical protein
VSAAAAAAVRLNQPPSPPRWPIQLRLCRLCRRRALRCQCWRRRRRRRRGAQAQGQDRRLPLPHTLQTHLRGVPCSEDASLRRAAASCPAQRRRHRCRGERHHDDTDARGRVPEPDLLLGVLQGEVARRGAGTASPTPARRSTEVPIKAEEEHQLRLLYTQHLQWRLVNAQAGTAFLFAERGCGGEGLMGELSVPLTC